jgi:hypothetical protein
MKEGAGIYSSPRLVLAELLVLDADLAVKEIIILRRTCGVQVGGRPASPMLASLPIC